MPIFRIKYSFNSSCTEYGHTDIEARNQQRAEDKFNNGDYEGDTDETDNYETDNYEVDSVEKISD